MSHPRAPGTGRTERWRSLPAWAWFTLYAVLVSSVSAALYIVSQYRFAGQAMSFGSAFLWQLAIYGLWGLSVPLIAYAGRRWRPRRDGWVISNRWLAPLPAYAAMFAALVPVHLLIYAFITWLARPSAASGPPPFSAVAGALMLERLPVSILLYWAIVGVLYADQHARELRERERIAGAVESELVRAQLHTLRAQLQPHFLFNALQSIASLTVSDPSAARQMTVGLADLLRSTIGRPEGQLVTLDEELALVRTYLAIEEIRHGDRLTISWEVPTEARRCLVPDLLLQPLAENAMRHGIEPMPGPVRLTITARAARGRLELLVEDDGQGLPPNWSMHAQAGLGLRMTARRLELLYSGDASIVVAPAPAGRGVRVTIDLPERTVAA